ncbi:MAG: alpha/beta hydrolase, partial [Pseudomonadales bacterium]|nr:alpha/beta hydrolase [Pseudomonadales bacterium]
MQFFGDQSRMTNKYPLSPAMAEFVQSSESFFPAHILEQGIAAQRIAYHAMTSHFARVEPQTVTCHDQQLMGVKIRRYQSKQTTNAPRVLFVHGGGFYLGSLDSHHSFCAQLTHDSGLNIISIDYRLAPESPYPCALNDLMSFYQELLQEDPSPLLLLGDSAGANLIAALTLRCRDNSITAAVGQILI